MRGMTVVAVQHRYRRIGFGNRGRRGSSEKPSFEGHNLTFDLTVLEGSLSKADGPASLFIDWFAARGGFGRVGVVGGVGWHRPVWHAGWYAHPAAGFVAGAAVGAAAASAYHPYYGETCGYYPYPPCY